MNGKRMKREQIRLRYNLNWRKKTALDENERHTKKRKIKAKTHEANKEDRQTAHTAQMESNCETLSNTCFALNFLIQFFGLTVCTLCIFCVVYSAECVFFFQRPFHSCPFSQSLLSSPSSLSSFSVSVWRSLRLGSLSFEGSAIALPLSSAL